MFPTGLSHAAPGSYHFWVNIGCTFLFLLALLAGCGGPGGPGTPAGRLTPLPRARTLRVVAFVDPGAARIAGHAARLGERIASASDHLAALAALQLELVAVRRDAAPAGDLTAALERLEQAAPAPEADLVLLYTADAPVGRTTTAQLVQSRYAGRYVVVRSPATLIPPDDPERLHRAEVELIEHGIGVIFGALPGCVAGLMASTPHLGRQPPVSFRPLDLQLMRAHARLDLRGGPRVPPAMATEVLALLDAARPDRCQAGLFDRRRALLAEVAAPPPPTAAPLAAGLAALAAGQHAEAWAACEPIARTAAPGEATRCAGLAGAALGKGDAAIRYLRAHLAARPDDEEALLVLAREVGRQGDDGAARGLLAGFVEGHPDHVRARVNLGIALARLGDLAGARQQWEAALARDPQNPDARELLDQLPP